MKYILTTVYHDEPMFIPAVPMNAKQEVCSENWKGEKSKSNGGVSYERTYKNV